jgi:hypothetical protein
VVNWLSGKINAANECQAARQHQHGAPPCIHPCLFATRRRVRMSAGGPLKSDSNRPILAVRTLTRRITPWAQGLRYMYESQHTLHFLRLLGHWGRDTYTQNTKTNRPNDTCICDGKISVSKSPPIETLLAKS